MRRFTVALLGSGEFEPWTEEADRWLLGRATGDGRVLVIPAASAPEGDRVFDMWADMGMAHYGRLGIPAEVVPLKTAADANDASLAGRLADASVAFFSGGNPAYLASILAGTVFWSAVLDQVDRGMGLTGCSAGVACLGELAIDTSRRDPIHGDPWRPGLRLFPNVVFGPHWDALESYVPGLTDFIVSSVPVGSRLVAVDERTALLGDGSAWTVAGSGSVRILEDGAWSEHAARSAFSWPLRPAPGGTAPPTGATRTAPLPGSP